MSLVGRHLAVLLSIVALLTVGSTVFAQSNWTNGTALPTAGAQMTSVTGDDGQIYIFGGYGDLNRSLRYDPSTDTYTTLAPLPNGVRGACSAVAPDGRILVIGGFNGSSQPHVQIYDAATDTWSQGATRVNG